MILKNIFRRNQLRLGLEIFCHSKNILRYKCYSLHRLHCIALTFLLLQGSAQVSLADFSPETPSVKWYNILSFRFMQPSTAECASTSNSVSFGSKQAKHDKQESDLSMYRGVQSQNTKEESSDESTIISSQTSTLTRNQGCDELQTAVSLRLEELANGWRSPDEEDEEGDSDSGSEDSDEERILVEFIEENVLEDVLEHEVCTNIYNFNQIYKFAVYFVFIC